MSYKSPKAQGLHQTLEIEKKKKKKIYFYLQPELSHVMGQI